MQRVGFVTLLGIAVFVLVGSACGGNDSAGASSDGGVRAKDFGLGNFSKPATVDNEWFPLRPGTQLVFRGSTTEGKESVLHRVVFTVTDLTKKIDGVRSVVLWDRDYSAGDLVEAEIAFFAQDDDGNVWQLGEYPEEYERGEIVKAPAWIHGVEGARAGLTMPAEPQLGLPSYAQGWGPAVGWNDRANTLEMGVRTCVPFDCFLDVLVIREFNRNQSGASQLKYYAPGVGSVRVGWMGPNEEERERMALVDLVHLAPEVLAETRQQVLEQDTRAYEISPDVYAKTLPLELPLP